MSVDRKLILTFFAEHVRALRTLVIANVERKMKLMDAVAKLWQQLDSASSIDRRGYFVKSLNLLQDELRLSCPVESKNPEFPTMPRLVDETSSLRENLYMLKIERYGLT